MAIRFNIILVLFIAQFISCDNVKNADQQADAKTVIFCDAETWQDDKFLDATGKFKLSNANGRTSEEKRSGEYSLKLTKEDPYGMTIYFKDLKPDEYFHVSVWHKGKGHIGLSDDIHDSFYKDVHEPVETDSLGWKKLEIEYYIPSNYRGDYLKVILCNFGDEPVFFDDLKIIKSSQRIFPSYDDGDIMNIFISDENFEKLRSKRDQAIEEGILTTADDDWVKAIIFHGNKVLDTRIRLKGDRLDHLQGEKWSYRVKIKGDNSWNGMKTFSIQTPAARYLLHEWFFHKALEKEDILHTRYGFVPVRINGESMGVYAWEEHFEKQLVESSNRREGPILKLTDDSYWIQDKLRAKKDLDYSVPFYDASVITPFGENDIINDTLLLNEFKRGRDLYYQYKYARGKASDIFDVEAAAKYYAMLDATNAYHTLHFFNQRFYYNPVLGKLEPIFFDSFPYNGIFDYYGSDLVIGRAGDEWISIHLKLFADQKFKKRYFEYLEKYSSHKFWEDTYRENEKETIKFNQMLLKEFPGYHFNIRDYYKIAEEARTAMNEIKEKDKKNDLFEVYNSRWHEVNTNYHGKADLEILPHLIKAYAQTSNQLQVENYTTDTFKIIGFSDIQEVESEKLKHKIVVPPANRSEEYVVDVKSNSRNHKFLFVEIRDQKFSVPVIPWEAPNREPEYLDVIHSFDLSELQRKNNVEVREDSLIFKGKIDLSKHLVIPENHVVKFEKGTTVDLTNGATFISYSSLFVAGTKEDPVIFKSSDHTGKGINVFQTKSKSVVEHAIFTGLTNMEFGGWLTTGAVCFYEADVDFRNATFEENKYCDDALNIVRSEYNIHNSVFKNTYSDAFDSDFCTGKIISTKFSSPGNDAIDFSGSEVIVEDCLVKDAGDKSISCGEASTITVRNCELEGGNIGVASKDNSEVFIEDSKIENVAYGLVAFCKKPEYGPAQITTKNILMKKYLFLHLIEEGSDLNFNNRKIFGQERNLAKRFY